MHEVSLVRDALEIVATSCEEHEIQWVKRIYLGVGELACVEPHALQYAFEILTQDTMFEETELLIETIEAKAYCQYCHHEFLMTYLKKDCPTCQQPHSGVISGYEIQVLKYDGE